jgi:hypothetical protein
MIALRELKTEILRDGVNLRVGPGEWDRIRASLPASGPPSPDELRVLAEIRAEARAVCPEFDAYFFPAFKAYLLADGRVDDAERFQVLRVVYGGGRIDDAERRFLSELWAELPDPSPEFTDLYQQAMRD